jgi:hypothetical protein
MVIGHNFLKKLLIIADWNNFQICGLVKSHATKSSTTLFWMNMNYGGKVNR